MSKFKFVQWYGIVVCLLMAACTDVDITMPKGPKGDIWGTERNVY